MTCARPAVGVALALLAALPYAAIALDEADELMPGRSLVIRTGAVAKFVCQPASGSFDLPDTSNDPAVSGASLVIRDVGGSESQTFTLPAGMGWRALGNPPGSRGFRYRGSASPGDCRSVLVKGNVVKATCAGDGITLALPFLGAARVILTVGGAKRYCASFGGVEVANAVGKLRRKDAPPPAVCDGPITSTTLGGTSTTLGGATTTSTTTGPTSTTPGFCGDTVCLTLFGESCTTCAADCGACGSCDVNGTCERAAGENCWGCFQDCGTCQCDHDDLCEPLAGERCGLCSDCYPCNACGDGVCVGGETCGGCPADCCPS
jgi:hypothetical protein